MDIGRQFGRGEGCEEGEGMMDKECKHVKVYADFTYTTSPPITPWICAVCGFKGEERSSSGRIGPSYQEIVEKFRDR